MNTTRTGQTKDSASTRHATQARGSAPTRQAAGHEPSDRDNEDNGDEIRERVGDVSAHATPLTVSGVACARHAAHPTRMRRARCPESGPPRDTARKARETPEHGARQRGAHQTRDACLGNRIDRSFESDRHHTFGQSAILGPFQDAPATYLARAWLDVMFEIVLGPLGGSGFGRLIRVRN